MGHTSRENSYSTGIIVASIILIVFSAVSYYMISKNPNLVINEAEKLLNRITENLKENHSSTPYTVEQETTNSIHITTTTHTGIPTATQIEPVPIHHPDPKIVYMVLEKINKERVAHGLPPVYPVNSTIAQYRAEDMVNDSYYGHCDLEGYPPNYWYTILGGVYVMEENIGIQINGEDEKEFINNIIDKMIYDDASSNWGHRNSLLDPTNNYADIGFAKKGNIMILVIHMQKIWVNWTQPPIYDPDTGKFSASGYINLNSSTLTSILIYKQEKDDKIYHYGEICSRITCTCPTYSTGIPIAGVVPSEYYYYKDIETIIADLWDSQGQYFTIEFTWKPQEPGIYTIIILAKNTLNITHPYDPGRYADNIPILEYTITLP